MIEKIDFQKYHDPLIEYFAEIADIVMNIYTRFRLAQGQIPYNTK